METGREYTRPVVRYVVAVLAVALVLAVKSAFAATTGVETPFTLLLAAVLIAAWHGGVGPGLLATVTAAAAAVYLFIPPYHEFQVTDRELYLRLLQFLAEGTFVSVLCGLRRRSSEQAHRRLEELRVTLHGIGDAVVATDADGRIRFLNPVAERLTGWPVAEATGRRSDEILHLVNEETRERAVCPIRRALRTGDTSRLPAPSLLVARDGTERPIGDTASPIHATDGRVVGAVVVFKDITDRRRAEAAREEAHRRTAAVLERIGDAFYAVDRAWRFTYVNAHARAYFGPRDGDLIGRTLWDAFPEIVGTEFEAHFREAAAGGTPARFEARSRVTGRDVEVNVYPGEDGLSVFFRDVTDRKRAEEDRARLTDQLAAEQDRLRAVLDQMPAGVLFAEAGSGRVVLANAQVAELLGSPAPDRVRADSSAWAAYRPDGTMVEPGAMPLVRALRGETVRGDEYSRPRPAGPPAWLRANAAPIRDRRGGLAGAVLVLDDVTAEKEAERTLRQSHAALRSRLATIAEDERRRLSRALHDETSQQMTALALGLRAAREQAVSDPAGLPAALEALQGQAAEVNAALHRIAWELRPAALDDVGLEPAVRDSVGRWARQTGLRVEFQSTLGARRLAADLETHLYRIVNEAVANAVKHAAASRIGVVLDGPPDELRVIVEDDGRGFDPDAAVEPAGRRLGLQGMAERAALIGGTFHVESEPGRGTTVFVRVPLAVHLGGDR